MMALRASLVVAATFALGYGSQAGMQSLPRPIRNRRAAPEATSMSTWRTTPPRLRCVSR